MNHILEVVLEEKGEEPGKPEKPGKAGKQENRGNPEKDFRIK